MLSIHCIYSIIIINYCNFIYRPFCRLFKLGPTRPIYDMCDKNQIIHYTCAMRSIIKGRGRGRERGRGEGEVEEEEEEEEETRR